MKNDTIVAVQNRSAGTVSYKIPEDNVRRMFAANEIKKIPYGELEKLSFQPGGRELMAEYLQISSEAATDELNIFPEQEYWMDENQIKNLILTGSQAAFLDCLDFAPAGVIDILKRLAVELPMSDLNKVRALKDKTGFDASSAIRHQEEERAPEAAIDTTPVRRVKEETPVQEGRRAAPTNYKVTKKTTSQ